MDAIRLLYGTFLLRDLAGYAIPGAVVAMAIAFRLGVSPDLRELPWKSGIVALAIGTPFFYVFGHAIAGFAYNICTNPIYAYEPYSVVSSDADLLDHVRAYNDVPGKSDEQRQQRERLAALTHLTGTNSAAMFLAALIISSPFKRVERTKVKKQILAGLVFLAAVGLWFHHFRLRERRFRYECKAIAEADASTTAVDRCVAFDSNFEPEKLEARGRSEIRDGAPW